MIPPTADDRLRVDWHNHTRDFSDGRLSVAEVAARGVALGLRIGIADHALRDNPRLRSRDQLLAYASALDAYRVLRGIEISLGEPSEPDDRWIGRFTHVIASMHTVPVGDASVNVVGYLNHRAGVIAAPPPVPADIDPQAYLDAVPALLEATFRRWPVTILGHFALVPTLAERAEPGRVDACLDTVADLAVRYGVAIELNNKSRVPDRAVVQQFARRGATFSFGADGHLPDGVGNLTAIWETWRATGISADRLLAPPLDGAS